MLEYTLGLWYLFFWWKVDFDVLHLFSLQQLKKVLDKLYLWMLEIVNILCFFFLMTDMKIGIPQNQLFFR